MSTARTELSKRREKTIANRRAEFEKNCAEYTSAEEAHEAMGWDIITEEEYEQIASFFKNGEDMIVAEDRDSISIKWLNEFIRRLTDTINALTYELLSDEDKIKFDKKVERQQAELEKKRRKLYDQ